jgi:ABC-type transporter Mla maintaining outer membrane lipid asymmetry ATPase subunit MlaF
MNCVELKQVRLEVEGKCYLDGVDLTVAAGESVVIAGMPGCGKSFIPRLLLGLPGMENEQVNVAGDIIVAGDNVMALSNQDLQAFRRRVGSVMRDGGLIENMDMRANITLPLTYHYRDVLGPDDIQARCDAVLGDLQLAHLGIGGIRPVAVNREERIYVSLARAMVCEPFLLLLDEPCAGLGPGPASRMCRCLFSYQPAFTPPLPVPDHDQQTHLTRIATTVDLGRYLDFADRFLLMWDGELEDLGDRTAVLDSADPRVRQLLYADAEASAEGPLGRVQMPHG